MRCFRRLQNLNILSWRSVGIGYKQVCVLASLFVFFAVIVYVCLSRDNETVQYREIPGQTYYKEKTSQLRVINDHERGRPVRPLLPTGVLEKGSSVRSSKVQEQDPSEKIPSSLMMYLETASRAVTNDTIDKQNKNCSQRLGPTPADDLAKIESYKFEGIQQHLDELFPPMQSEPVLPQIPVFVTAFSSNHFHEGLQLFKDIRDIVRPKYKELKVIFYDIGLMNEQVHELNGTCECEVRKFQFDKYPNHVRNLQNYAWKTIVIQLVARDHPFLSWMDASVRWKTGNLDDLFAAARKNWLMADDTGRIVNETIPERTLKQTFESLKENPCTFGTHGEKHATYLFLVANLFMTKYFLRPWVSCALSFGCMDPVPNSAMYLPCPANQVPFKYHLCHRFDQSVLGILFVRLFHRDAMQHAIDRKYFMFCGAIVKAERNCIYFDKNITNPAV